MKKYTPRTDQHQNDYAYELFDVVDVQFAQQLERELNASKAEIDRLREKAKNWHRHYRDEANKAQKCKQAYIEQEKEVERLHDYIKRVLLLLDSDLQTKETSKFWDEYESQYGKIQ